MTRLLLAAPAGTVLGDVADILGVLVWPAVVVALLWFLRKPLFALAERASQQAQRVSVGAFAIDFGGAVEQVSDQSAMALAKIRQPDPTFRVNDSTAASIMEELRRAEAAPYVLVDLGEGSEWLTSRLYIFAILLGRMRRTRAFVFVETANGIRGQFVGLAPPSAVRWALAAAYPWLEADHVHAYAEATSWARSPQPGAQPLVLDDAGRLPENVTTNLVNGFLDQVQTPAAGIVPAQAPDWTTIERPTGTLNEHAAWLSAAGLEGVLGAALAPFAYISESTPRPAVETTRTALQFSGHELIGARG